MDSITLAHVAPAFTIGLLATLNPCVLPLYPGYLAYLANDSGGTGGKDARQLGFTVLCGVLTMMLALGAVIALLAEALAAWSALLLQPIGAATMILMGLLLLLGRNPFARMSVVGAPDGGGSPNTQAFLYGLWFGPMIMPCAGPLVVSIFSLAIGIASFVEQLLFFLLFGLGFGFPLLALSFVPRPWAERLLAPLARQADFVSRASGVALLALGIWNFRASWEILGLLASS